MSPDAPRTAPAAAPAPRLYYGWVIVAVVLALLAVAYTAWYSYALFLVALVREFGWARADAAGAFSVYVLTHAACSPIAGRLADRFGPRPLVHGGALLTGLAFLGCSQLTALWQLYLCYGVLAAIGVTVMGWVPCITLVGRWFSRRVGLAVGIAGAGIGLGTFLAAPPLQYLIDAHGWRTAYVALAVVLVLVPQPLALLLRARPEDMGLARDGAPLVASAPSRQGDGVGNRPAPGTTRAPAPSPQPPPTDPRIVDAQWARQDWTVGRAIRTWRFRLLFAAFVLTGFGVHQTHTHQVAYLIGDGYDPLLAAMVMGTIGLVSILGKIVVGTASDWLGREVMMALGLGAGATAMLLLISFADGGSPAILLFLYAILFAAGYSVTAPLSPAITSDLFYGRHYGAIYGMMNVSGGLGGAIGTWLAGLIFDRTGSYQGAWLLVMVAFLTAALFGWIVAPRKVLRTPGQARRAEAARHRAQAQAPASASSQPPNGQLPVTTGSPLAPAAPAGRSSTPSPGPDR